MRADCDALIVGAGPAGSTAAILLAQAGWSVTLLEQHAFPRRKVCGECIAATNLPLLDALGVGAAFDAAAGPPLERVALMWGEHAVEAPLPAQAHPLHRFGRALGRETLDTLLLERARALGVRVLQPCVARSVSRASVGTLWRCDAGAPREPAIALHAPVVIAAHGSWGPVGRLDDSAARPHRDADLFAFKANFSGSRLGAGLLPVLAFAGGYGGMVLGDAGTLTLAGCVRRDALRAMRDAAPGCGAAEAVEAHLREHCAGVRDALQGARREGAWLAVGPIRPGIRMPRRGGDVFRIGNAAGEAHPIIGEGMSMAMQSAWLLARRLVRDQDALRAGRGHAEAARAHASAWRAAFAPRIRLAAACAHLAMRPAVARALGPIVRRFPASLATAARLAGKVDSAVEPARAAAAPPARAIPIGPSERHP